MPNPGNPNIKNSPTGKSVKTLVYTPEGKLDRSVLTPTQMRAIAAFRKARGIVSLACKMAEISRDTFYRYKRENKVFAEFIERSKEDTTDVVRNKLWEKIDKGDWRAISFFLKANAPEFSDKVTIDGKITVTPSWYEQMEPMKIPGKEKILIESALENDEPEKAKQILERNDVEIEEEP